jgi:hypothetical protein
MPAIYDELTVMVINWRQCSQASQVENVTKRIILEPELGDWWKKTCPRLLLRVSRNGEKKQFRGSPHFPLRLLILISLVTVYQKPPDDTLRFGSSDCRVSIDNSRIPLSQ